MKKFYLACGLLTSAMMATTSQAEGLGVTAKFGTLGAGIELSKGFTSKLNGRLGFNTFTFDESASESGVDYDIDLELSTFTALLDWHPFESSLRATVGVVFNGNELDLQAKSSAASFDIGGVTYTGADVGTFAGKVEFDDLVPYAGIGWGNAVETGQKFTFSLDLGVMFQGTPNAVLTSTGGTLSANPIFQSNLKREVADLQKALDKFEVYPVISLGIAWQF